MLISVLICPSFVTLITSIAQLQYLFSSFVTWPHIRAIQSSCLKHNINDLQLDDWFQFLFPCISVYRFSQVPGPSIFTRTSDSFPEKVHSSGKGMAARHVWMIIGQERFVWLQSERNSGQAGIYWLVSKNFVCDDRRCLELISEWKGKGEDGGDDCSDCAQGDASLRAPVFAKKERGKRNQKMKTIMGSMRENGDDNYYRCNPARISERKEKRWNKIKIRIRRAGCFLHLHSNCYQNLLVHHKENDATHDMELHGSGQEPRVQEADFICFLEIIYEQDVVKPGIAVRERNKSMESHVRLIAFVRHDVMEQTGTNRHIVAVFSTERGHRGPEPMSGKAIAIPIVAK